MNPKYPIYVISKGRWQTPLTANALLKDNVSFRIVVEPAEADKYASVLPAEIIFVAPENFSERGQGSIPVRNFIWKHSIDAGFERHWCVDDNIGRFHRLYKNRRARIEAGTFFRLMEDFTDRYENVALSGPHYYVFIRRRGLWSPFLLNHRIYSCILIKNDLPFRWRGRYNEDTDLSLRVLKNGWCTILFRAFLQAKAPIMTMKGGNTDELYKQTKEFDGRLEMAKSLQRQHPDVVCITRKWNRWQHHVDYRPFKGNKLIPKDDIQERIENSRYDLKLVEIENGAGNAILA